MIIAHEYELEIGRKIIGPVYSLQEEWIIATFIVLEKVTLNDMLNQLDELGYPRENYVIIDKMKYYKVQVD